MPTEPLAELIAPFIEAFKAPERTRVLQRLIDKHHRIFQSLVDADLTYGEIAALMQKNGVHNNGEPISEKNWRTKLVRAKVVLPQRRRTQKDKAVAFTPTSSAATSQVRDPDEIRSPKKGYPSAASPPPDQSPFGDLGPLREGLKAAGEAEERKAALQKKTEANESDGF